MERRDCWNAREASRGAVRGRGLVGQETRDTEPVRRKRHGSKLDYEVAEKPEAAGPYRLAAAQGKGIRPLPRRDSPGLGKSEARSIFPGKDV